MALCTLYDDRSWELNVVLSTRYMGRHRKTNTKPKAMHMERDISPKADNGSKK